MGVWGRGALGLPSGATLSRSYCHGCAFDFGNLFSRKLQRSGAHDTFRLLGIARADNRSGDGRRSQHPGDGHFTGGAAVALADLAKPFDQLEIFGETRLAEFRIASAKIIVWQGGGAFAGHGASEKSGSHWRVTDHPDSPLFAIGENFGFHFAADDGAGRVQGSDPYGSLGALDLCRVEIGNSDPADFAFGLQRGESLPGVFQAGFTIVWGPVPLVEIDVVGLQAAETVFAFPADRIGTEFLPHFSLVVPSQDALGENIGTRAAPFLQRARDDLFGVTQAVDGGSVDPVDAQLQRAMNRGNGIGVVLRAPRKFPATSTEGPSADDDGRHFEI